MEWTFRNDLPIYSQLVEQIKLGIVSGAYVPGERLSSVRDLATDAGVNPNTMQRALQELEREGLVFSQRTSGRFVTEDVALIDSAKRAIASACSSHGFAWVSSNHVKQASSMCMCGLESNG